MWNHNQGWSRDQYPRGKNTWWTDCSKNGQYDERSKSEHFGKLYGITRTIGGCSTFLAVPIFKWVSSGNFQIFYTHPRYSFLFQITLDIQSYIQGTDTSRQDIYNHDHLYKEQPRTRVRLFGIVCSWSCSCQFCSLYLVLFLKQLFIYKYPWQELTLISIAFGQFWVTDLGLGTFWTSKKIKNRTSGVPNVPMQKNWKMSFWSKIAFLSKIHDFKIKIWDV